MCDVLIIVVISYYGREWEHSRKTLKQISRGLSKKQTPIAILKSNEKNSSCIMYSNTNCTSTSTSNTNCSRGYQYQLQHIGCCSSIRIRIWPCQSDSILKGHSAVCPLVADETDAGKEAPVTGLAPESGWRIDRVFCSSFSCPAFFFGGVGSLGFWVKGALVDHATPGWSVRCCVFPCGDVDGEVFEVSFQGVFEALTLSSHLPYPMLKFTVQQLLGYSGVWHSGDVTCPACLCLAHGGDDAGELCSLQHLVSGILSCQRMSRKLRRHRRWNWWICFSCLL